MWLADNKSEFETLKKGKKKMNLKGRNNKIIPKDNLDWNNDLLDFLKLRKTGRDKKNPFIKSH
jgi:hypothetical protein